MAKFDAFAVDTAVLLDEDRVMISKLVAKSAEEQAGYSATDDERRKEEIAMRWHATRRSFDEGAFCDGDEEGWKAYVNGGLVFGVAEVAKLWSTEQFLFSHIENKLMFQEAQPYATAQQQQAAAQPDAQPAAEAKEGGAEPAAAQPAQPAQPPVDVFKELSKKQTRGRVSLRVTKKPKKAVFKQNQNIVIKGRPIADVDYQNLRSEAERINQQPIPLLFKSKNSSEKQRNRFTVNY